MEHTYSGNKCKW